MPPTNFAQEETDRLVQEAQLIFNNTDEKRCAHYVTDVLV